MNVAPQSLTISTMNFTTVPADAPQLQAGLEEFENLMKTNANELRNGWGAVIITEPQNNLKRVDVIITWDEVKIENGRPVWTPPEIRSRCWTTTAIRSAV